MSAKRFLEVLFVSATLALAVSTIDTRAQSAPAAAGTAYKLVENWLHPGPGQQIGGVSAAGLDRQGMLFVFRRCPIPCPQQHPPAGSPPGTVQTVDSSGKFLNVFGAAREAHGVHVDREGFIWTSDVQEHTVRKYKADGTLLMTLGTPNVPGTTEKTFNKPTAVFVAPNGDVFVADGYGNQRVMKFNKSGQFIKTWGTRGTGPGQLRLPHGIVMDSHGRLIVADRCGEGETGCTGNSIAVFDADGKYLDRWPVSAYGLDIDRDDRLYVGDVRTSSVFILDSQTGKQLGAILKTAASPHTVAVDWSGDNVYVSRWGGPTAGLHRYSRR